MYVIRRRGWEIPERLATPEHLVLNRRALRAATGAAGVARADDRFGSWSCENALEGACCIAIWASLAASHRFGLSCVGDYALITATSG
jgi:hypothetical protein